VKLLYPWIQRGLNPGINSFFFSSEIRMLPKMKQFTRLLSISFVAALLVGCGGGSSGTAAPPVALPNEGGEGGGGVTKQMKAPSVPPPPKQ
jgi:hypothetical protein